MGSHSLL